MSNVVDMFSRKPMGVGTQDTEANGNLVVEGGTYVGHVDKDMAKMVTQAGIAVEDRATQIDAIVVQWQIMSMKYYEMVDDMFTLLNVEGFDPATQALQISEEGHVWVVPRRDVDTSEVPEY